jgi:murein DD-endopeptidase MepM/ murein hydrolase activator NlpD
MKKWLLFGLVLYSINAGAFPRANPVPGGIAEIPLAPQSAPAPIVQYAGQRVTVAANNGQWVALVGIPFDAQAGTYSIQVRNGNPIEFNVQDKQYRTQRITLKDNNMVEPDDESSARIVRELAIQKQLRTRFSAGDANIDFIRPAAGADTGRFGMRRIFNGQSRNPHSGMDIAAAAGTPIKSSAAGRILYTGNLFFSGNVVYIDHGAGVISMYAHLSKITVNVGDSVQQGDIVGEVGSSGRATGPHLHWSVYLNGEAADPSLFL